MIRLTPNSFIIEIPTGNTNPLEDLGNMQQGLLNLMGVIDHKEPEGEIQNGLWHLRKLLKEMSLSQPQLSCISDAIASNPDFQKAFAA